MELVLRNKDQELSGNNKYSGVSTFGDNVVIVNTVAQLEAAVAAQTAGQTIVMIAGDYTLTKSLEILLAASGGGLKADGCVNIIGAAAANEAILIDPAVATATFEYTLEGINSIKGGANKIGLHVLDTATNKKVNVYLKQTSLNDNGTGKALTVVNSDGSNAIRVYADGPAEIDSIAFTPKDDGDRLVISGYDINENIVIAAVDCTATFAFRQCKLPHAGVTGGHANNVCSVVGCWTEETEYVPVEVDANDFPGALNPTILNVSGSNTVRVNTVAELELAVSEQTAGQFIELSPGTYNLTESLEIPLAADGGGLIGLGIVVINGINAADEAIKINTAAAAGTFEYTIGGGIETKGGAGKIALKIVNGASTQKTIVYVNDTANFLDNAAGVAISIVNTGTGAIRLYVNGNGQGFDTINITPKVADDRFTFRNISIDENMVVAADIAVAATFFFANCKLPHEGITGGGASNVVSTVGCWTEATAFVPVAVDASDFPGNFSATIL